MKNIFRTGISILLVMSLMLAAMPLAFAADSYYYEDFEDFNFSTYTWDSSNYTVKLGESDTGYCINVDVKVKGNATSDLKYVSYKNLSMTGKVTMEFDFMTNIDFGLVAFFNGGKKADVFNHLRDGRGAFAGDYSKGTRAPVWFDEKGGDNILKEGKWYHVALYMDLSKSTYTYKIDGKSGKNCGNDYSVIYNTIQLPAGSTTLTGFGIIGTWAGGDISIDNLEIYQGDKAEGGSSFKSGLGSKLTALGVLETAPDESLSITKAEFTKMLLKAMGITPVCSDSGVEFSDIDNHPDRPYLEYAISMGILSGKGDGTLGPDDVLDMGTAAKMAVSALGAQAMADAKGGYQAGYLESAKRLDLLDNIEADESFTYKQAMQMIWNFLEAPALDMYGNKLEPVMYQYLGLSRLKGEVTSFDPDSLYISLNVTEENGEDVTKTETFRIPKEYSSFNWDGVIAEVYMDDDYNVLYIEPYEDSGSRYGYLYSVNDKMESGSVSADTIKELSLFDGSEFKAHKDMELCVNGTPVSSAVLNNAFVHLVLEENRVVRMDIINDRVDPIYGNMLIEGGIINSTREDEIRFTSGENNYGLIEDADREGYTVVVGGTAGTIKQLKKGMLFDYKINSDGSYFFVAANRTVEGTVDELSSDVIKIGGAEYLLSEGSVYVQENGEDYYRTDIPLNSLLGVSVDASLDPTGRVRYIRLNEDGSEFYGIVCGARKASGLDSTRELMIFTRNGESIYKMGS